MMHAATITLTPFDHSEAASALLASILQDAPEDPLLVAEIDKAGKPVGSICHAAWVLVSAKILKGRTATCYFAIKDDLVNAGAIWEDAPVVVDRHFISSRKPDDLPQFCAAMIELMGKSRA